MWDEVQPVQITTKHLIVSGDSVAALTENVVDAGGRSVLSIDTYDFDAGGNGYERNYFAIPA